MFVFAQRPKAPQLKAEPSPPRFSHDFANVPVHAGFPRHASATASYAHPIAQEAHGSRGEPLDATTLAFFERRFGHSFSRVRVHSDAEAAASAQGLSALAYTMGSDLVFARGQYNPSSQAGRRLLAHELTHHVQQSTEMNRGKLPIASDHSSEAEADSNADRIEIGAQAQVKVRAPVRVARKGNQGDPAADHSFWFQSKPPEKPTATKEGIPISPKGQVFVDPSVSKITSASLGTFSVQFAGLDTDFRNGKPLPAFAAAEQAILTAIKGSARDLESLPEITNAPSQKAAETQRAKDETVRARLKEAERTLDGKTLNVFIATDLSVAENMSPGTPPLRTEQIFVRAEDMGDQKKLEAGIRVPLVSLMGGETGLSAESGKVKAKHADALDAEHAREAVLHEMIHVMLINKGVSAVQLWQASRNGMVAGPDEVKTLAEDVLFRYLRAQEEIFVYTAIAGVYTGFADNKDHYVDFTKLVEAFLHDVGAKLDKPKTTKIDVKEKVLQGKKMVGVDWSITYTVPKSMTLKASEVGALKLLQKFDIGT